MRKVAVVIPYFGEFPEWMELYLHSCGKNRMVDFLIYTDCAIPERHSGNVVFRKISFGDYCDMVSARLGIDFHPDSPRKLCDLKVFYGEIHREDLNGYDFWGFGDLDVVYGDLGMIINQRNLRRYDLLTTHSYHIAGHLTLARNNRRWSELCYRVKGWREILADDGLAAIDEGEWSNLALPHLRYTRKICSMIMGNKGGLLRFLDMTNGVFCNRITRRFVKEMHTTPNPEPARGKAPEWVYSPSAGRVYGPENRELPYLHFLFFKRNHWHESEFHWRPGFYRIGEDDIRDGQKDIIFNYERIMVRR